MKPASPTIHGKPVEGYDPVGRVADGKLVVAQFTTDVGLGRGGAAKLEVF